MEIRKKALWLSYITVGYNIIEGVVSIFAGMLAGSIALIGFGSDSFVESLSGSVMIWRFRKHGKISHDEEMAVEKKAVRLVAYAFFILAAYILFESVKKIYSGETPDPSIAGIIIAIISIIVMPVLFYEKNKVGKTINSRSLIADSKQTLGCVFLSVALLIGLGLNYLFGIWWADPVAGLVIGVFFIREGRHTLKEEQLCSC